MFRILLLMLALTLCPLPALAELSFGENLTGVYTWPEGASEEEASYLYRYSYPQISGEGEIALAINTVFQYEATDALGFECPMTASSHDPALGQMTVDIACQIVHLSDEILSVRIDKTVAVGENVTRIVRAFTFALTGDKAGMVTSLPYLLGIVKDNETDEWLINRQTEKADDCAREMVWALIEEDMDNADAGIYEDLTFEEFEWGFYPEEDFYMDEEGNFVFFIQEGVIAPTEAGQFFYVIPVEDMLDEI